MKCVEPTGSGNAAHAAYIRQNFLNQCQCKIPVRLGSHAGHYGFLHVEARGKEKVAQGRVNNHEVSPYAQDLWRMAIARVGGALQPGSDPSYFAASIKYTTSTGAKRTMCVFYDVKNYATGGLTYKVKGLITAYWIPKQSGNPTQDCIDAKGTSD